MNVIFGLIVLVAALVAGVAGVLGNGGSGHALTHGFAVFGYHVTGSTGTLFLYGIVVGAIALAGLSLLLAGAHTASALGNGTPAAPPLQAPARAGGACSHARPLPARPRRSPRSRWPASGPPMPLQVRPPPQGTSRTAATRECREKIALDRGGQRRRNENRRPRHR